MGSEAIAVGPRFRPEDPGPPKLIGRDAECLVLDELLAAARGGHSKTLLLRGEAGIGKTALLDYAKASATGLEILMATGIESEARLVFAGLADLLTPLRSHLGALPEAQCAALTAALSLGTARPRALEDRFSVCAATLSLLATVAEQAPVLLCVDDAHWLDSASAGALAFAARRLSAEGIAMLYATRPDVPSRLAASGLPTLTVAGLSAGAGAELLAEHAGGAVPPAVARHVVAATLGNPLALHEVARGLTAEQLAGLTPLEEPLAVGTDSDRIFRRRLDRLPDAARPMLLLAAAAGEAETAVLAQAAAVAGLDLRDLDSAEADGLVAYDHDRVRFFHPLLRSVVCQEAKPGELRRAHRALAAAFGTASQHATDRRAWHLSRATVEPDAVVADDLEGAADRARGRSGFAVASRFYERAAELTVPGQRRGQRLLAAGQSAQLAGLADHALRLFQAAWEQTDDPMLHADVALQRWAVQIWRSGPLVTRDVLLRESEGVEGADPERAVWLLLAAVNCSIMADDLRTALALARRGYDLSEVATSSARGFAGSLLGSVLILRGDLREGLSLLSPPRPPFDRQAVLRSAQHLVVGVAAPLMWAGRYPPARALIEAVVTAGRSESAPAVLPFALGFLSELDYREGHWLAGYANASESLTLAIQTDEIAARAYALTCLARIEAAHGQEEVCRDHLRQVGEMVEPLGVGSLQMYSYAIGGMLELGLGRVEAAIAELEPVGQRDATNGLGNPSVLHQHPDLVEAYLRAGRREDAQRTMAALAAQADGTGLAWAMAVAARCRGLLAAAAADADRHFKEALEHHDAVAAPFDRARTELCCGERLRRDRRPAEARGYLGSALTAFERLRRDRGRRERARSCPPREHDRAGPPSRPTGRS